MTDYVVSGEGKVAGGDMAWQPFYAILRGAVRPPAVSTLMAQRLVYYMDLSCWVTTNVTTLMVIIVRFTQKSTRSDFIFVALYKY